MKTYNFKTSEKGFKVFPSFEGYPFKTALRLAFLCYKAIKNPEVKLPNTQVK